jgi:uncharacterized protein (DUF169 family)
MPGLKEVEQMLNTFIRPSTFPVAIKMLSSEDEMPERTRRPFQQIKKKVAICQGIGMSRKLGWTIGMGKEDMQCALGAAPFGFFKNIDFFNEGNMAVDMFTVSKELGKTEEDLVDRFDYGVYSHILVAPLSRAAFDPDGCYPVFFHGEAGVRCHYYGDEKRPMPISRSRKWRPDLRYDPGS